MSLRHLALLAGWLLVAFAGTAPAAAPTFQRGVNISHWLAQNNPDRPYGAPWFDEEDVAWVAAQGFDHLRVPVDGREWVLPGSVLDEKKIAPFDQALAWSKKHGLGIVLDMHYLPGASSDPETEDDALFSNASLQLRVAELWRRVARRFASEGEHLRFEVLNEPTATDMRKLNQFHARMVAAIRESNAKRVVYLSVPRWKSGKSFTGFVVPDDKAVAVTFHFYQPLEFTHQRAPWAGFSPTMPAVAFPGPETKPELSLAFIERSLGEAAAWAREHAPDHEIYIGEFGVYAPADDDSTRNYLRAFVATAKKLRFSWAVWDYQGGFAVRDDKGQPTAVLEGLGIHGKQ